MRHHCLHFFLHHSGFYKTIATIVLVTFTWLFVYPTALVAQTRGNTPTHTPGQASSEEAELSTILQQIEALLATLEAKLDQGQDTDEEEQALAALHTRLKTLDTQVRTNFARLEQQLKDKGLPDEILQRHTRMVATYNTEVSTLLTHLHTMKHATEATVRSEACARALQHLQTKQHKRRHQPFDPNNLPFRVPDGTVRKPRKTKKEFQSSLATPKPVMLASTAILPGMFAATQASILSALPTPDDLAPTEDAQITDAIKTLAAELDHDPVQIYNWVHDNIEFLPTYGSIQGSQMALDNRKGNAFDTASLLIALLRASDIPARYVLGTIEVPIDQVMNWVGGVHVPEAALEVLGQGGIPSTGIAQGGVITAVKLEHVWVEAWVDFEPSRGAVHRHGDTWVPMDASFKQYEYSTGLNLPQSSLLIQNNLFNQIIQDSESNETEGWARNIDHRDLETASKAIITGLDSIIESKFGTEATLGDVLGNKTIQARVALLLSVSLPYQVIVTALSVAALPSTLRHTFRFQLYKDQLEQIFENPDIDYQASLPALAGKKITVSFSPATGMDDALLNSFLPTPNEAGSSIDVNDLPRSFPGYLINVIPEVKVNGEVVASGSQVNLGTELPTRAGFWSPSKGSIMADNISVAGEFAAIGILAQDISHDSLLAHRARLESTKLLIEEGTISSLSKEELTGDVLHAVIQYYLWLTKTGSRLRSRLSNVVHYTLPSFGFFQTRLKPNYFFGVPQTVQLAGLNMDVDLFRSIGMAKDNNRQTWLTYLRTFGYLLSVNEHHAPERILSTPDHFAESVSAVKALFAASAAGQRIFTIDQTNLDTALPQLAIDDEIKEKISAAVGAGQEATVSETTVAVGDWTGLGYILFDPETGSGAYKISGGSNGADLPLPIGRDLAAGAVGIAGIILIAIGGAAMGAIVTPVVFPIFAALTLILALQLFIVGILVDRQLTGQDNQWDGIKSDVYAVGGIVVSALGYILGGFVVAAVIATIISIVNSVIDRIDG